MTSKKRNCEAKSSKEGETPSKYFKLTSNKDECEGDIQAPASDQKVNNAPIPQTVPTSVMIPCGTRLTQTFFDIPCTDLARALLGQHLVRMIGSQRVSGKIVETEAYLGLEDKAAHSYKGKRTERNEAMFKQPGTAYVYNIYGMYCCLNISSQGDGCAVLLRALEPLENIDVMRETRGKKSSKKQKDKEMTNGPSKLCQALQISKAEFNLTDLTTSKVMWLEKGDPVPEDKIISCARINIGYAEEWEHKPLRFYVLGNECVSTRNKQAEAEKLSVSIPVDK